MAIKPLPVVFMVDEQHIPALKTILSQFPSVSDDRLTLAEACREFGVSAWTIDNWVNKAKLVPFSQPVPGGKKYVRRSDIQALLTAKAEAKGKPRRRKSILNIQPNPKKRRTTA